MNAVTHVSDGSECVSVIRYVNPVEGGDLSNVLEAVRPYVFRSYQQRSVAILVSDMSGFTRLTRKYGAIHFTSIIARTRQLCLPILHKFDAMLITAEGDSLNVVFPSAENAVLAALDMQRVCKEYNNTLPNERAHFALTLNGVGVDFGPGPLLDREGKLHGQTFANAHLLGEELCSKGRVAISQACCEQLKVADRFTNASFEAMPLLDSKVAHEAIDAMGSIYEVGMNNLEPISLTPCDAANYLQAALVQFCSRHSPGISDAELAALDAGIAERFLRKQVVLMLDFEYFNVDTPSQELGLKFACLSRLEKIFNAHKARKVEDVLYLFDDPVDALLCATECRSNVETYNRTKDNQDDGKVFIRGFGAHVGELLLIEGTDVHWGDPVNTASKLGQDFATNADIIVSAETYDLCKKDHRLQELAFEQIEVEISGVHFTPYKVKSKSRLLDPDTPRLKGVHRASSMLFRAEDFPTTSDSEKSKIIETCTDCGFTSEVRVDVKTISDLMRRLNPNVNDDRIRNMVWRAQKELPKDNMLTLPAFVEWCFNEADAEKGSAKNMVDNRMIVG